jgi:hypothetical protein
MGLVLPPTVAPCKDCKDRVVGCHAVCDAYSEWARANRERHEEALKQFYIDKGLREYEIRVNEKCKRRWNTNGRC